MSIFRKPADGMEPGDAMPFFWNGEYHLFYLISRPQDLRYPERNRNFWYHAVSKDLIEWRELPIALEPGVGDEIDATGVWTGSVVENEGIFHMYYVACNFGQHNPQKIAHATSKDLIAWEKDPNNPIIVPDESVFEDKDWRDPNVFYNEKEQQWWMMISARMNKGPIRRRGAVALCTSKDLKEWSKPVPFFTPYLTDTPECTELFQLGDKWYMAYSRYSESVQTLYHIADDPRGPWRSPEVQGLDSRRFYAAKSCTDDQGRRIFFGWSHKRMGDSDEGEWQWGGDFNVPREVYQLPNKDLGVRPVKEAVDCYTKRVNTDFHTVIGDWKLYGKDAVTCEAVGTLGFGYFDCKEKDLLFRCKITPTDVREYFGLLLKSDKDMECGYNLRFEPGAKRVCLVKLPQPMDPYWETLSGRKPAQVEIDGPRVAERPYQVIDNKPIDIKVFVYGSVLEVFVDDVVSLTYRGYEDGEYAIGAMVQDGAVKLSKLDFAVQE